MAYYSLDRKQFTTLELSVRIIEKKNYYKIFSTPKPYALIFSCNAEKLEEILQYNNSDTTQMLEKTLPDDASVVFFLIRLIVSARERDENATISLVQQITPQQYSAQSFKLRNVSQTLSCCYEAHNFEKEQLVTLT